MSISMQMIGGGNVPAERSDNTSTNNKHGARYGDHSNENSSTTMPNIN